jgi:hypothetical protein
MKKNISLLLGSLALVACSGGAAPAPESFDAPDQQDAPRAAPTHAPAAAPAPTADAGTHVDTHIARHCNASAAQPDVCIENVEGHGGETIDVEVFLVGDATCKLANEASGHIQLDLSHFVVENQEEIVNCRTRMVDQNPITGGVDLRWSAFGDHVVAGCSDMPTGKVDTIKVTIQRGTPAGDYKLTWSSAGLVGAVAGPAQCSTFDAGMSGIVRVLP